MGRAGLALGTFSVGTPLLFFVLGEAGLLCGISPDHSVACMLATLALVYLSFAGLPAAVLGLGLSLAGLIAADGPLLSRLGIAGLVLNGIAVAGAAWFWLASP